MVVVAAHHTPRRSLTQKGRSYRSFFFSGENGGNAVRATAALALLSILILLQVIGAVVPLETAKKFEKTYCSFFMLGFHISDQ